MKIDVKRNDIVMKTGIIFKKEHTYYEYIVTSTLSEEEWATVGDILNKRMDVRFPAGLSEAPPDISMEVRSEEMLSLICKRVMKKKKKGVANWNSYQWVPRVYANKAFAEGWFDEVLAQWQEVKDLLEGTKEISNIEQESSYSL